MKFMNQNKSLSLYFNSLSDFSKSLSLLNCESLIGWLLLFFCFCLFKFGFILSVFVGQCVGVGKILIVISVTCVVICDWHCEIF